MPQWTPEQAREMAARGGRTSATRRRAVAARDPMRELREELERDLLSYVRELKAAAAGDGVYERLDVKDRVSVNKFLLELTYGRPTARRDVPAGPKPEDDDGEEGFRLVVGGEE